MNKLNNKLLKQLDEFTSYCLSNPEQRFFQALRNWNQIEHPEQNFILTAEVGKTLLWDKQEDTFYRE